MTEVEALHRESFLCVQNNELDKAQALLEKAIDLETSYAVLHAHLGNVYRRKQWYDEAEKCYQTALQLDAQSAEVHNSYGLLCYARHNYAEAVRCFTQALTYRSDYLEAMYNLALALHALGKTEEAVASLMALVDAAPMHASAHFLLGKILLEKGLYSEADQYFQFTANLCPSDIEVLSSIIKCWLEHDRYMEAKKYCEQFLALQKDHVDILYNMGIIETRLEDVDKAMQYYQRVLEIHPQHFPSLNNLAVLYLQQHSMETAKYYFERALQVQPDNVALQYTLNALSGEGGFDAAPQTYIRSLFDGYAYHFDKHVQYALDYRVPDLLKQYVETVLDEVPTDWHILDLGCGTGLCGEVFAPWASYMVGVDLSPKMLEMAREKKCYDVLTVGENMDYVSHCVEQFDLIVAGDVLVYQGDLEALFSACHRVLEGNGLFVFSIELGSQQDFTMLPTGRFAHAPAYIQRLADAAGFDVLVQEVAPTRMQQNDWVPGCCFVLRKVRKNLGSV